MSWINDPVNSPKHYTDSHPGMECIADRELEWWKQVAVSAWSFINGTEKEQ